MPSGRSRRRVDRFVATPPVARLRRAGWACCTTRAPRPARATRARGSEALPLAAVRGRGARVPALERGDARHRGRCCSPSLSSDGGRLAAQWPSPRGQARGAVRCRGDTGFRPACSWTHLTLPFLRADWPPATRWQGSHALGSSRWTFERGNFTDGADGLAAGVCTIAAATFAIIALSLGRDEAVSWPALTAGASVGFLWHKFHPASIFWATPAQNLLGLLLACVAIQGVLKTPRRVPCSSRC